MSITRINKIEDLIPLDGRKIINYEVTRLVAPGENYGSLILSLTLTVQSPDGTEEEMHTIIKKVPPNKHLQEVFNTHITFRNEIAFYSKVVPLLQNFQRESGIERVIDFAPKYCGGRLNLENHDENGVDSEAALVLENLKVANYITLERTQGLDLDAAKLILANLAQLHAVPLVLRLKKPEVFDKEIRPYLFNFTVTEENRDRLNREKGIIGSIVDQIEELKTLRDRILTGFSKHLVPLEKEGTYDTIVHNDCWTNNTMLRFENGKAVGGKLVDFQFGGFSSPAQDLVFFLFTSVKNHIVEESYQELLQYYHSIFAKILDDLQCDKIFSFEDLEREMDREAVSQFGHVAFILIPMYASRKKVTDIENFTPDSMSNLAQNVSDLHKQKFIFVVKEFIKRNWIYFFLFSCPQNVV